MNKIVRGIVGAVVTAVMVAGGSSVAEARVTLVPSDPVKVVVKEPVPSFTATLRTNTTLDGKHYASIWINSPVSGHLLFAGEGGGESRDVSVTGDVFTDEVKPHWGLVDAMAVDDVDGRSTGLTLDVRRRTRVSITRVTKLHSGVTFVSVSVQHYNGDGLAGKYIPSKSSPVQLQERTLGRNWGKVDSTVTDSNGAATLVVSATPGRHIYRVYRPNGATVWSAISKTRVVD